MGIPRLLILDFTESSCLPIAAPEVIPGTPDCNIFLELLLSDFLLHSEITLSIDIWAFGCTALKRLGDEDLFVATMGTRAGVLADMIFKRREIEGFPERY